jgi:hypothetical protein
MAKAKRVKFMQYHGPAMAKHKHVRYVTKIDGRLKMSTSFITVKLDQPSDGFNGDAGNLIDDKTLLRIDDILFNAEALDPAYVEHLAEVGIEQPRRRGDLPSVSFLHHQNM